jgi:hypothetical protein
VNCVKIDSHDLTGTRVGRSCLVDSQQQVSNLVHIVLKIVCACYCFLTPAFYRTRAIWFSTRVYKCSFLKKDSRAQYVYVLYFLSSDRFILRLVCQQAIGFMCLQKCIVSLLGAFIQLTPLGLHNQNKICESALQGINYNVAELTCTWCWLTLLGALDQLASRSVKKEINHNMRKLRVWIQEYASLIIRMFAESLKMNY